MIIDIMTHITAFAVGVGVTSIVFNMWVWVIPRAIRNDETCPATDNYGNLYRIPLRKREDFQREVKGMEFSEYEDFKDRWAKYRV